jgi:hypothetical protein
VELIVLSLFGSMALLVVHAVEAFVPPKPARGPRYHHYLGVFTETCQE